MMSRDELLAEIHARESEPVSDEELARRRAIPITPEEIAETQSLARWFLRRYPTAKERFAYVRRKHAEWTRKR